MWFMTRSKAMVYYQAHYLDLFGFYKSLHFNFRQS